MGLHTEGASAATETSAQGESALHSIDFRQIPEQLTFNTEEGLIWHNDRRMVLMHADSIGALREEIIESYGMEEARALLTRFGYSAGSRDAELALRLYKDQATTYDLVFSGGKFHALQGIAVVEMIKSEIDAEKGVCNLEFSWRNCFQDHAHVQAYGIGEDVACWIETGYASGFLSVCMGKRVLVREVECRAQGYDACRLLARPVDEWGDVDSDLRYYDVLHWKIDRAKGRETGGSPARSSSGSIVGPDNHSVAKFIGASVPFNILMHKVSRVAPTAATVLLLGESGVGKSALAKEIQQLSSRSQGPFLELNCAAIPEQLVESELFGAEKGAFTGAVSRREGRFEAADGGTLFLDEVGTLSMTAQGKLLRAIQSGEFEPLGSSQSRRVDVRIIAATNEDLWSLVQEGRFRQDLYYRLNVFPVVIPPLRKRRDDIPVLIEHLMKKYMARHDKAISGIGSRALQLIMNHSWPGNIRELENVIERGIILADEGRPLSHRHLFTIDGSLQGDSLMSLNRTGALTEYGALVSESGVDGEINIEVEALHAWSEGIVERENLTLDDIENSLVTAAYHHAGGNASKAAMKLGMTRAQFAYRAKKLNLRS